MKGRRERERERGEEIREGRLQKTSTSPWDVTQAILWNWTKISQWTIPKELYPVSPTSSTGSPNSNALPTRTANLLMPSLHTIRLNSDSSGFVWVDDLPIQGRKKKIVGSSEYNLVHIQQMFWFTYPVTSGHFHWRKETEDTIFSWNVFQELLESHQLPPASWLGLLEA